MTDLSSKHAVIIDNQLFLETAVTLRKSFGGDVGYWTPWQSHSPKTSEIAIGKGIPGIDRIERLWSWLKDHGPDDTLVVCPDVYHGDLQFHLQEMGYRVWGARFGEDLELMREEAKIYLKGIGLAIGDYKVLQGVKALRRWIKDHENVYVKASKTRGDMESFLAENYDQIEWRLDKLDFDLGPYKEEAMFIVEEAIDPAVEVGYDGYCVNGVFPNSACIGIESKGKAYVGHFVPESKMPTQLLDINKAMAPALTEFEYRNFFCIESRITKDGTPWLLDPCTRFGSPPSELLQLLYKNLAQIFWAGGEGECIDPEPSGEYGAELILHSSWAEERPQNIQFPEEIRENVKLRNFTMVDGKYQVMPQYVKMTDVGAVVAVGATLKEACDRCKEYAEQVTGHGIEVFPHALDSAGEEIEKLKSFGVTL